MNSKVTKLNTNLGPDQQYSDKDIALINSIQLQRKFSLPEDYVELHLFDLNDNLLKNNYNYTGYKSLLRSLPDQDNLITDLTLDATQDAINMGYDYGSVKLEYNVYRKLFNSDINNQFFIKTISTDRTELRISNNNISNIGLESLYNDFIVKFNNDPYYKDFYLNFGENRLLIGVNIVLEQNPSQYNLLIKLYEPLPTDLELKSQFWLVDKLSDPIAYQVDFEIVNEITTEQYQLKGPNFNIKINEEINPSVDYVNYNSFFSTTSTSSYQQLKSVLEEKSLDINVDYTEYENFIHFSSARERLLNFAYKLKLIEGYKADVNVLANAIVTPQISSSKAVLENNINNLIEKFDGYEYYLYYESGSKAWPKKSSSKPYVNYEITSSTAINWLGSDNDNDVLYGGQLYSASIYDSNNQDNIIYTIPEYLRIDEQNKGYEVFLHMIGQHFDNIWLYSKGITDLYDAQNNLNKGISKDLVSYALKSLGVKLYSNTSTTSDIFSYLLGVTPSGSYQYSTGSEAISSFVTASQYSLTGADIDKEIYKRIYHNLPFLLKTKGTERGLRALIACYGIPNTILRINEFGGTDKDSGSFEQYFERLSYALNTKTGSVYVVTPWAPSFYQSLSSSVGSGSIVPDTIEFRFKTNGIPTSPNFYSQSLFQINSGSSTQFGVQLLYVSQSSTGAYNDYGQLKLVMSGNQGYIYSNPIYLPFFDNEWWNVMIYRETGSLVSSSITNNNRYWLYAANSIYQGHDGETIGYIGSASLFITGSTSSSYNRSWNLYDTSSFIAHLGGQDNNQKISSGSGTFKFNGFFQELRYWATPLPVENFIGHTLSPLSIECINETSSYNKLIFRLPLGNDLFTTQSSIVFSNHPAFTGSVASTGSFILNSTISSYGQIINPGLTLYGVAIYGQDVYYGLGTSIVYTGNTDFYYLKSGNLGLGKPTNDKIRILSEDNASGSTLSINTKIEQSPEVSLTKDVNTLEVAFSPQDQINNDIIYQLGYFNIDDYIGDPREASSITYNNLRNLREFYFQKYIRSYNVFDFIRLLKYYNNSLFKMIKDYVPARTNVSTGIIIKPHLLERPKYKRNEPTITNISYSQSIDMIEVSGDEGGILKQNYTYAYTQSVPSLLGNIKEVKPYKSERYTGEISGSVVKVTDQSLQPNNTFIRRENSFGINSFKHSDYNVLLNNVTQSRLSNKYFDLDYSTNPTIAVNIGLVMSQSNIVKAPIQDSNYTLKRHINSRYIGSKTFSTLYNIYTEGDSSYGKTAAIDNNVRKLGLFTNVTESKFLPRRQEARLKYLVDEYGGLTELNLLNLNWFEVQNTFKSNDTGSVALFDVNKFGDQRTTNGEKLIFNSGYDYLPMLYFSSSDARLYFESTGESVSKLFYYTNTNGAFLSGSSTLLYPITGGKVYNMFDNADPDYAAGNVYYTGGLVASKTSASYVVPENNVYKFLSTFNITLGYTGSGFSGSFTNKIKKNDVEVVSETKSYTSSVDIEHYEDDFAASSKTYYYDDGSYGFVGSFFTDKEIRLMDNGVVKGIIASGSEVWYISGSTAPPCSLQQNVTRLIRTGSAPAFPNINTNLSGVLVSNNDTTTCVGFNMRSASGAWSYKNGDVTSSLFRTVGSSNTLSGTLAFNTTTSYDTYVVNDVINFELTFNGSNTNNFTASVDTGAQYNLIQASAGVFPSATTSSALFISGSTGDNTFILNSDISTYLNYLYVPSTGSNALYSKYGDVNFEFSPTVYDYIVLYVYNASTGITIRYEYNVIRSYTSGGKVHLEIDSALPTSLDKGVYSVGDYNEFLLLKRLKDETMVLLNFNKRQGATSYGFVIPETLHTEVLKNIDVITKEVKQKLIELNNTQA